MTRETPEQRAERLSMEAQCADIGRVIAGAVRAAQPPGGHWGFCLLMFDFGAGGSLAYMSNGKRLDIVKMLDEFRAKLMDGAPLDEA